MADNVTLDAGSGGATIKTDDDGTAHWQYVKTAFGADNTQTIVTSTVGLPVELLAGTAEFGKLAAGTAEIGNVKNSGTFAVQATLDAETTKVIGTINVASGQTMATTNAGTFAVQEDGAALTALQLIDNTVYVDDADWTALTSSHNLIGGVYQSTPGTINDGDTGPIRLDANGAVHINDGGNSITIDGTVTANAGTGTFTVDGSGVTQPVSGTVTANLSATDNAVLDQLEINTSYGDSVGGGTEAAALRVTIANDSTGVVSIDDNGGSITVDNAGTFATQATLQTGANTIGEVTIGAATGATGDLAKTQDVAMGANDVGIAMLAVRDDEQAVMTPVDGDYTTLRTDRFGNLKVTQLPDATSAVKYGIIDAASSGDNTLQAAAGAGVKIRVLSVMMVSAGTVTVRFESGAAGTALTGQMNLVANSGFTLPYNPAGWFETADNTLLNLELSGAVSVDGCFTYVEV